MQRLLTMLLMAAIIVCSATTVCAGDRWFFLMEGEPGTWYWPENCYNSWMVSTVTTHMADLTALPNGDQIASIMGALPTTTTTEFVYLFKDQAGNYRLEWRLNIDEVNSGQYIAPGGWWWEVPGKRDVFGWWKWLNTQGKGAAERIFEEAYEHGRKMIPYRKGPPDPNYTFDEGIGDGLGH